MLWGLWNNTIEKKATVTVAQPPSIALENMWVKPALGGIVIKCSHPRCYWDWYSPVGGIQLGSIIDAVEEHITKKHS